MSAAELARIDRMLSRLVCVPEGMRDQGWSDLVDTLLARRSVLMADRERGFRFKVR